MACPNFIPRRIHRPASQLFIFLLLCTAAATAQKADSTTLWYNKLPACPCRSPDYAGVVLHDGWARDKADLNKYHKGAFSSYRSYPAIKTSEGYSCQQCCYDRNGDLITSGRAAGTPDKISACRGENSKGIMTIRPFGLIGHYFRDVHPWLKDMRADTTGWKKYNAAWLPNAGNGCKLNTPTP
jgi:hypothetical protein